GLYGGPLSRGEVLGGGQAAQELGRRLPAGGELELALQVAAQDEGQQRDEALPTAVRGELARAEPLQLAQRLPRRPAARRARGAAVVEVKPCRGNQQQRQRHEREPGACGRRW